MQLLVMPAQPAPDECVVTNDTRESFILSYQTFVTFPSLSYLSYLLTLCSLYQSFVTLSIFRRLIKLLSSSRPLLSIHFLRYHLTL